MVLVWSSFSIEYDSHSEHGGLKIPQFDSVTIRTSTLVLVCCCRPWLCPCWECPQYSDAASSSKYSCCHRDSWKKQDLKSMTTMTTTTTTMMMMIIMTMLLPCSIPYNNTVIRVLFLVIRYEQSSSSSASMLLLLLLLVLRARVRACSGSAGVVLPPPSASVCVRNHSHTSVSPCAVLTVIPCGHPPSSAPPPLDGGDYDYSGDGSSSSSGSCSHDLCEQTCLVHPCAARVP